MRVLLTGATGFVGSHLAPALSGAGLDLGCASRHPESARETFPDREWVGVDVLDASSVESALRGCEAAFYLVHGMSEGADYPEREARSAEIFLRAAETVGVRRVVYLGGVMPASGEASKHLQSRARTGEILRSGAVSTIELRAAMIMGAGGASWTMVEDLAARLPAMVLPKWLANVSYPVALDDVVWALLAALHWPDTGSRVFEIPGPERITHEDVLRRVSVILGHRPPMVSVPVLTPRLSSYWIALITRVDLGMARELVEGVKHDLVPREPILWNRVSRRPMPLEDAARLAMADEHDGPGPSPSAAERLETLGRRQTAKDIALPWTNPHSCAPP